MSRGMTRQRDELHAVDDWLGATKRVPLTILDVRRCDGLRTLEERLRILRCLSSDFRRQPKVAFGLRSVEPVRIEYAGTIVQGRYFEVADFQSVEARRLIMMLGCGRQSCVGTGDEAEQRCQDSGGEAHRNSLEHVTL